MHFAYYKRSKRSDSGPFSTICGTRNSYLNYVQDVYVENGIQNHSCGTPQLLELHVQDDGRFESFRLSSYLVAVTTSSNRNSATAGVQRAGQGNTLANEQLEDGTQNTTPNDRWGHEVAERHRPTLYLHPHEQYYPGDILKYFENSEENPFPGETSDGNGTPTYLVGRRPLDMDPLAEKFDSNIPIIYRLSYNGTRLRSITYFFWWRFNGSKRIASIYPTGAHWADMEQFVVKFHPTQVNVVAYFGLSSHGDMLVANISPDLRNRYLFPDITEDKVMEIIRKSVNVDLDNTGYPIIFAAHNSHALYPKAGAYLRFRAFGNDYCGKGKRVTPTLIPFSQVASEVTQYRGSLSVNAGIDGFPQRINEAGEPTLTGKATPTTYRINRHVTWLGHVGWLLVPAAVCTVVFACVDDTWRTLLTTLVVSCHMQFYLVFVVMYVVAHVGKCSGNLDLDSEPWYKYLFLYRPSPPFS